MNNRKKILLKYMSADIIDIVLDYIVHISWEIIDKHTIDFYGPNILTIVCDKCKIHFKTDECWYQLKNESLIFCVICWNKYNPTYIYTEKGKNQLKEKYKKQRKQRREQKRKKKHKKINKILHTHGRNLMIKEHIKKPKKTRKQKNRQKYNRLVEKKSEEKENSEDNCILCKDMVYGYDPFFREIQICKICHVSLKNNFELCSVPDNIIYLMMGTIKYDLTPIINRVIPYQLYDATFNINIWEKHITQGIVLDEEFGSIKQWAVFTDLYKIPFLNTCVCFLVDCSIKTNGRVAIMVIDNCEWRTHNKYINVYIVYGCIQDYLKSYDIWKNISLPRDIKKSYNYINDIFMRWNCLVLMRWGYILKNELYKLPFMCEEFSGYVYTKYVNYRHERYTFITYGGQCGWMINSVRIDNVPLIVL